MPWSVFLSLQAIFPHKNEIILIKKKRMIKPWIIFKIWKHYISPSVAKQHTFAMTQSWDLDQHSQLYRKDTETGLQNKVFKNE